MSIDVVTGKSLSEGLPFAEHGEKMLCTKLVMNVRNNFCTQHVFPRFELGIFMCWACNSMNNLTSRCGLVDAKIRASDKNLSVRVQTKVYYSTVNEDFFFLPKACSGVTGARPLFPRLEITSESFLRSLWHPHRITGALLRYCRISGIHLFLTL